MIINQRFVGNEVRLRPLGGVAERSDAISWKQGFCFLLLIDNNFLSIFSHFKLMIILPSNNGGNTWPLMRWGPWPKITSYFLADIESVTQSIELLYLFSVVERLFEIYCSARVSIGGQIMREFVEWRSKRCTVTFQLLKGKTSAQFGVARDVMHVLNSDVWLDLAVGP